MAEALKNMYTADFITRLSKALSKEAGIDAQTFQKLVLDAQWEQRELKERSKHIARCMDEVLSGTFSEKLEILYRIAPEYSGFIAIIFSDFVELFGLNDWEKSMEAMAIFTQRCTAEFAVRPFFMLDFERMVKQHQLWSKSENEHIRRLASEGIRPRLPWGAGVPQLKKDPNPIFPILENLMMDDSEYVRRSVANNLNDISKDHPQQVLNFVKHRDFNHKNTQRLVKHALRGLLKKAHPDALALFGFASNLSFSQVKLELPQARIAMGSAIHWNFQIHAKGPGKLRLEYHVHYQKANGTRTPKVFQLSEQEIKVEQMIRQTRKLSFQDLSTRKHYPGIHEIHLVANGNSIARQEFELIAPE